MGLDLSLYHCKPGEDNVEIFYGRKTWGIWETIVEITKGELHNQSIFYFKDIEPLETIISILEPIISDALKYFYINAICENEYPFIEEELSEAADELDSKIINYFYSEKVMDKLHHSNILECPLGTDWANNSLVRFYFTVSAYIRKYKKLSPDEQKRISFMLVASY